MNEKHDLYLNILKDYLSKKENVEIISTEGGFGCPVFPDITAIDSSRDIYLFYELKVESICSISCGKSVLFELRWCFYAISSKIPT